MEVRKVSLAAVGVRLEQYPKDGKPEIAFVGKSNVGKSTLINSLVNRKSLARTSSSPGKTRTINFYDVEDLFYIVDLPGYGYAKAPKTEIQKWGKMIESYLLKRKTLKAICMLVDIRHKPGENDILMYKWLKHYNYDVVIIATKLDKINRSQVNSQLSMIKTSFGLDKNDRLIPFSGLSKTGKEDVWLEIERLINFDAIKNQD